MSTAARTVENIRLDKLKQDAERMRKYSVSVALYTVDKLEKETIDCTIQEFFAQKRLDGVIDELETS